MPCRIIHLEQALLGYQKTRIPLIEYNGSVIPFSAADDMGLYILIPKLATLLSLTIDQTIYLFFYGITFLGWLTSLIGFLLLYQSPLQRIIACIGISLLCIFSLKIGDIYLLYVLPTITLVPWILYFFKKPLVVNSYIFYCSAGFIISLSHYIRTHSCLAVLLCIIWLLVVKNCPLKKKIFVGLFFSLGLAIPIGYFSYCHKVYSDFIQKEHIADPAAGITNHLFWHSIYAGLGFLSFKNPDNIRWGDPYPVQKAQAINPNVLYNTLEYEQILQGEVIKIIKNHPAFVIMSLFAKIGILILYLIVFANFGLIAALFYPKSWQIELAFWGALITSSLPSLLVLPVPEYSLGFITFATLYGIISINKIFKI